jgi:hypothetical protein
MRETREQRQRRRFWAQVKADLAGVGAELILSGTALVIIALAACAWWPK